MQPFARARLDRLKALKAPVVVFNHFGHPLFAGAQETYSAHVLHMPGVRFDRSGSHRAEGQQVRSKTCDGTVPSARLSQHWVHRPMRHRAPFLP